MTRLLTIAIASAGRPSLVRTLNSLDEIDRPADLDIRIVVADDDPNGGARRLVEAMPPMRTPVTVTAVGSRNIARARNGCLEAASGDFLAFVDDDEWVARDWLMRMFAALRDFDADCVFGPVHPQYPAGTPDWLVAANPLYVEWGHRGKRVEIGRTGNTLVKRALIERHALRFDPKFGQTGGSDTDFFHRLGKTGAIMVVTDDAMIYEDAPPERLKPTYLRMLALRKGQSYARHRLAAIASPGGRAGFVAGALLKAAAGYAMTAALRPVDRARSLKMLMKARLNAGKLREVAGRPMPAVYRAVEDVQRPA
ncbi:MAG: glycosyltransferase family 2 protein [Hyphomicrobiaceae bacterium]